jgi:hypothetical protein
VNGTAVEIGQLIDAKPTEVVTYANELTYAECNGIVKLLEIELQRIILGRKQITNSPRHENWLKDYTTTFVVEQKILDRLDLVTSVKIAKGVPLNVFSGNIPQ